MFFVVRSHDSFNFPLGLIKYIVIIMIIARYLTEKGEHTALYKINKNVCTVKTIKYCINIIVYSPLAPVSRRARARAHTHTHTHTYIHTHKDTHTHTHTHTQRHTHTHKHTHTHTQHINTHTHTHTHTTYTHTPAP